MGRGNTRVDPIALEVETWKYPDEGALSEDYLKSYQARKRGVTLYFAGASAITIKSEVNLSLSYIYRLINERCLLVHPDGQVWGWRGLIPNIRINAHQRKTKIDVDNFGMGASGALNSLFNQYPDLRTKFEKRVLTITKGSNLAIVKRNKMAHYNWFLQQARSLGLEETNSWPFNTEKGGYVTICKYIKSLWEQNPWQAAKILGGPDAQQKLLAGDGVGRPVTRVFQRVEMDAHKLDGRFSIAIPQPTGGFTYKIVHRLWVIVIIEVVSRAVIGYHLSMRREVSKFDVLRALKVALTQWKRPAISFGEHAYNINANLPSGIAEEYIGVCWDETSVDGALAETCKTVKTVLENVVGSQLITPENSFAIRRSKDDRPFIEAFFRQLASLGFQKLGNTTGSNPKTRPSKDPDEIAITSQFQYEYAKELLDVLIANYNVTPHSSLGARSPLEYLKFRFSQLGEKRYADPHSVMCMVSFRKLCTVKGGYSTGKLPFINFQHGRYGSDTLSQRHDLVGQKIWVITHIEDDIRVVLASTESGQPLGILTVRSPWSGLPHSIEVRNAIQSLISTGKLKVAAGYDAVEVFIQFSESQVGKKLPVHPAYMEARRILTGIAASVTDSVNPASNSQPEDDLKGNPIGSSTAASVEVKKRLLPAHRKAAN